MITFFLFILLVGVLIVKLAGVAAPIDDLLLFDNDDDDDGVDGV